MTFQGSTIRIALAQLNVTVGDLAGNTEKIVAAVAEARAAGAKLIVLPELALCGYPPEDLLLREDFLADCQTQLRRIAAEARDDELVLVGFPQIADHGLFNAVAVCNAGQVQATYQKMRLPNYGVFDERRYFHAGQRPAVVQVGDHRIGLTVCEDIWIAGAPLTDEALAGAELIVNLSASPYEQAKGAVREQLLSQRARDNVAAIAYCNLVGGQDELIFDGQSMIVDHRGRTVARAEQFTEQVVVADVNLAKVQAGRVRDGRRLDAGADVDVVADLPFPEPDSRQVATAVATPLDPRAEVYEALKLAVADYARKTGFQRVVLGLSGGVDSALVAAVAADALGPENVTCVVMPSQFSSDATQSDARRMGDMLGVDTREIAIAPMMDAFNGALARDFQGLDSDVTEENLQARIRGNLLMAMSNKFGWLVLTTGNKSEMSVGYTTLYGDMSGGFAVLKDVPKLLVFDLCRWRNEQAAKAGQPLPIPPSIIDRPPSAELRDDQRDDQALPPYPILDPILELLIEEDEPVEHIIARGYDAADVHRVAKLVRIAEYKRRQAPPGAKITPRAFGRDRRMPMVNGYR